MWQRPVGMGPVGISVVRQVRPGSGAGRVTIWRVRPGALGSYTESVALRSSAPLDAKHHHLMERERIRRTSHQPDKCWAPRGKCLLNPVELAAQVFCEGSMRDVPRHEAHAHPVSRERGERSIQRLLLAAPEEGSHWPWLEIGGGHAVCPRPPLYGGESHATAQSKPRPRLNHCAQESIADPRSSQNSGRSATCNSTEDTTYQPTAQCSHQSDRPGRERAVALGQK